MFFLILCPCFPRFENSSHRHKCVTGHSKALAAVATSAHFSQLNGQHVVVDGDWLVHRGLQTLAAELIATLQMKDLPVPARLVQPLVKYCARSLRSLLDSGIRVTVVFSGQGQPMKMNEDGTRQARRKDSYRQAVTLESQGKDEDARKKYSAAVTKSTQIVHILAAGLRKAGHQVSSPRVKRMARLLG